MKITMQAWNAHKNLMARVIAGGASEARAIQERWKEQGLKTSEFIDLIFATVTEHGEATAEIACQIYDEIAAASGLNLPAAEPAETPSMEEVAKMVNATKDSDKELERGAGRLIKRTAADTTLKNAIRDGAQFAWIPSGDSCPFCMTLAANGWQYASKKALKNGHAEHIHPNCDCHYTVRFNDDTTVEGYDPDEYKKIYDEAEGKTPQEKINSIRREQYAKENGDGPDFYTGANGKTIPAKYKNWIGTNQMQNMKEACKSDLAKKVITSDFRPHSFIGDGDTASIRKFELATGLNCAREGRNHAQKVKDLIRQINKTLLKDIPESDKILLRERLNNLIEVDK